MSIEKQLIERSENKCELCNATENLTVYAVPPAKEKNMDNAILICNTCNEQIEDPEKVSPNHWRCLNDSMWSEVEAVKVMAWRMLSRLKSEGWTQDLLDMMYLEDETLKWARVTGEGSDEEILKHRDVNGVELLHGDSVTIIKDLVVKGGNFTAKRGVAVRNISLVHDNHEHIEGKVNKQRIVILTEFVKKN